MIQTNYDPEADVLRLSFAHEGTRYDISQEVTPGVFIELDREGQTIGVEVTSVSLRNSKAASVISKAAE